MTAAVFTGTTNVTGTKMIVGSQFTPGNIKVVATYTLGRYTLTSPAHTFYMGDPTSYNFTIDGSAQTPAGVSAGTYTYSFTPFTSTFVVASGITSNSFSVAVPYGSASPVYYDDLSTVYTDTAFTNSGTKTSTTVNIEGCYPVFATISSITAVSQLATLYSMVSTLNISSGAINTAIPITLFAESSTSNRQTILLPSLMCNGRSVNIYAYDALTSKYDLLETSSYIVSTTTKTITPYGGSATNVTYKQYTYNGTLRGSQAVAVTVV